MNYTALKTPGVYVNEISIFPPSVAQVPTAIPAFIGYTEKHESTNGESLRLKPTKVSSLVEYQLYFGSGPKLVFDKNTGNGVELDSNNQVVKAINKQSYYLFDSLQLFFANGGGECYIISVETYRSDGTVQLGSPSTGMTGGLEVLKEVDEPTMIVFPDAVSMAGLDLYTLQQSALSQCAELMDRVGVFDIKEAIDKSGLTTQVKEFRDNIGMSYLKYGAVYAPWLKVGIRKDVHYADIKGQIVKAGTNIAIDLTTLVKNVSAADEAIIKGLITSLNEIVEDRLFIQNRIASFLSTSNAEFAEFSPVGYAIDYPSLAEGFDIMANEVYNRIAEAEAEPIATQPAKVTASANELLKLIRQVYNLAILLDDFGFKDAAFIKNQKFVENTWGQLGYTAPFPAFPTNAVGDFLTQLTLLRTWDATLADSTIDGVKLLAVNAALVSASAPVSDLNFQTFNLPPAVANAATTLQVAAPASDADRLINQRAAVGKIKGLFTYFHNIVSGVLSFVSILERSTEDALIKSWPVYKSIIDAINNTLTKLPPSGAMAGVYSRVDSERGVWKSPANVSVTLSKGTLVNINDKTQESLNVDVDAGKSVNAIRVFSGKGVMVWGARTLAGNDNEWRYISVRRFFNMVEESVKKATSWVVFEPNDANTWVKVKSMIENYLTLLWRQGALAGAKPEEAFRVYVGLNQTMTFVDILEGRMIIRIEMAAVRPAEFIILEFTHKVQTS